MPHVDEVHFEEGIMAPLWVPLRRRTQTLVLLLWLLALPIFFSCSVVAALLTMIASYFAYFVDPPSVWLATCLPVWFALITMYAAAVLWLDRRYQRDGGRIQAVTGSAFFKAISRHYIAFFPARVIFDCGDDASTIDTTFPTNKNYIFACHPHGVFGFGVWAAFVASSGAFYDHFMQRPSHRFSVTAHTMSINFFFPLWREFLLMLGFCDVDRRTLLHRLRRRGASDAMGRITVLVPGGASESVDCTIPMLTLLQRKGFVRIALETGASLVPVYTFGETELYRPLLPHESPRGKSIMGLLHRLQKVVGVGTPLVRGRGIFNYSVGALPHRVRLSTVIGVPIDVPLISTLR